MTLVFNQENRLNAVLPSVYFRVYKEQQRSTLLQASCYSITAQPQSPPGLAQGYCYIRVYTFMARN